MKPKLRFKEFSDEWCETTLGETTTFKQGIQVDVDKQFSKPFDNSVRFIRIVDYTQNTKDIRYISKPANANYVDEHDVVLVRYGATAGFVGHGIKGVIANNMFTVTPNSNINKDFLYTILKQDKIYNKLNSSNGSSAMPALNFGSVSILKFSYPSIDEQNKLTNLINLLDKKIELQSKKIEDLKLFKKGLINKVINELSFYKKIELSELGVTYTGLTGKTKEDFENGESHYIPFADILNNKINIDILPLVNIKKNEIQNKVRKYDLFFNTSSETANEVGLCTTLNFDIENTYLNSFCFGYRINDVNKINNEYLNILLHSNIYRKKISILGQGFTRVNISKNKLMKIKVLIPTYKEQLEIVDVINIENNKLVLEESKLYKLQKVKKGLMQNMFV